MCRKSGISLLSFLRSEVTRGYLVSQDEDLYSEKQRRVLTFWKTPRELEKLMAFGMAVCLHSFLFLFTFLPLRVAWALASATAKTVVCPRNSRLLEPAQKCDLARALILVVCGGAMVYVDTSQVYHLVRGQSVIKLYVIYNMLEIFDRLAASIGQDVLDSLYWVLSGSSKRTRDALPVLFYSTVATVYVFLHSGLILCQIVTVNVAINSHNKALLTVMVSNQFVELKGSVFKKFDTTNLFQMSCSDIRERFHYVVLLSIVCIRNWAQFEWDTEYFFYTLLPLVLAVGASEVAVDWIKHAFITKFNYIPPDVYCKYTAILARDLSTSTQQMAHSEHSDLVSRRMGFTPLPLTCLVFQTLWTFVPFPGPSGKLCLVIGFTLLLSFKILLGILLLGRANKYRASTESFEEASGRDGQRAHQSGSQEPAGTREPSSLRKRSSRPTPKPAVSKQPLSEIERFSMSGNRIV